VEQRTWPKIFRKPLEDHKKELINNERVVEFDSPMTNKEQSQF